MRTLHGNMTKTIGTAWACLLVSCSQPDTALYADFESVDANTKLPTGWFVADETGAYRVMTDSSVAYHGRSALLLEYRKPGSGPFELAAALAQLPVDFAGSQIRVSAYIRTENVREGICGLYLRTEGDPAWSEMEAMASGKLNGSNDWKRYEITMPLKKGTRNICLGAYNSGTGKVWVDDLEVRVDEKPLSSVPRIALLPAQQDTAFGFRSGIVVDSVSPQLAEHLVILGKVWGFLKYYHPAVAAGLYNWDAELFRILPEILQSNDDQQRNRILLRWARSLKPVKEKNTSFPADTQQVKLSPDLDWLADHATLGDSLSRELVAISRLPRGDRHYYVTLQAFGNASFTNENNYTWLTFPDGGIRLMTLFRYWNIIQYYYPYRHLIGEDWNQVLRRFVPLMLQAKSDSAWQLTMLQLVASIHDSHAYLQGRVMRVEQFMGEYILPAEVRYIEGLPTITESHAEGKGDALERGDQVLKVNGVAVSDIEDRLRPYIPASNTSHGKATIATKILRGNDSVFHLEVKRNDGVRQLQLTDGVKWYARRFPQKEIPRAWSILSENVGYINLGALQKAEIPNMMKSLMETRGIIIDIRSYPRELVYDVLASYLTGKKARFSSNYYGSIQEPGMFRMKLWHSVGGYNRFPYRGKVIVLVDDRTESRGEFVAMALKAIPTITLMGDVTAGTDGDVTEFFLPGGLRTRITGVGVAWPDGSETQRTGIIPDIFVKPTAKGIRNGKDEVLEAALSHINK